KAQSIAGENARISTQLPIPACIAPVALRRLWHEPLRTGGGCFRGHARWRSILLVRLARAQGADRRACGSKRCGPPIQGREVPAPLSEGRYVPAVGTRSEGMPVS